MTATRQSTARRLLFWIAAASACAPQPDGRPQVASTRESVPAAGAQGLGINQRASCTITHVSDGDSVVCDPIGRVRLLLIDAPELAAGDIGRDSRRELLEIMPVGTEVVAETDVRVTDQFGRVLAYLFLADGSMVNEQMVESGYATALVYPPNVKYVERIRGAVESARRAKRGLWASGGFNCAPRDYRAGRCR